ncbi:phage late control D family protein [Ferviditalea candida]|uniref:Uncharacterized protein n=1 Tax=Ferviditalea candida TaxID=3108399 RepID=A0ABU5ZKQ5_9BACL|nr:hypothetical protein [Paenibacillaceae bacterium T2]
MNIIYNGTDITSSVQPTVLQITDNAGGKPDSVTAVFSNTEGLWSKWKPSKNDTLRIKQDGFDTGTMYIDELTQGAGVFGLKALSIPQIAKTARSQGWENVRFLEIATRIAARYRFGLQTYNVVNHLYSRVDQIEEPDFAFLAYRSMLEGYALKINNGNLVIYDEATEEQKAPDAVNGKIFLRDLHGAFEFKDKSTDIYAKCIVRSQMSSGYIQGEYSASGIYGPTMKRNLYMTNQAEANRWARGLLRSTNKYMITGTFGIDLNPNLAAGTSVNVSEVGMFDGKFFIDRLIHDLIHNRTQLTIRKPLEGY